MKYQLSTVDLAIWLALITGKVFLCVCLLKKNDRKNVLERLPIFSAYILVTALKSLGLFILGFWGSYALYYHFFYWAGHAESALAFIVLVEFGRQVLPGIDLPRRWEALNYLIAALGVIVCLMYLWPQHFIEKRLEVTSYLVVAAGFIWVTWYSRSLRLSWSRLLGGVSFTLGFLFITQGITKALMGHFPPASMLVIRQISEIANVAAIASWTIFVLMPWGEYKLTEEDLAKFEGIVNAAEENVRRFIASGGQ